MAGQIIPSGTVTKYDGLDVENPEMFIGRNRNVTKQKWLSSAALLFVARNV